ncbi:cell division protein PerM [Actinokineospora sp.]|uniref:cell division protein PerM n=1 Tax=Actinokineospora sp. TaxID=1872133 RepID=UPI0040382032
MALPSDLVEADADLVEPQVGAAVRARVLAVAALGPLLAGYAAVAALLALVTAIAPLAHFSTVGVLGAALPGWLAAHQVPLGVQGHLLGALPLLPTLLVLLMVARTAAGAAERIGVRGPRDAAHVVFVVVAAHAAFGLAVALFISGGEVTVDPLAGFYYPALLAGLAASLGVVRQAGLPAWVAERVDVLALRGLRAGLLAVAALLAVGALVTAFGLVTSFDTAKGMFALDGLGGGVGMLLLSAGYLPNAVVAGTAFAAGPGFALGSVSVGPLDFSGGPVPALPLLSALPERYAPWWLLLFALPAAVGVLVGRVLRDVDESPTARLRAVAVASVVVALSFAILGGSAGGALGGGPFDPLDLRAALLSVALVGWVAVPGALVAWFGGPHPVSDGPTGLLDDAEDDSDEDPVEDDPAEDLAEDSAEDPAEDAADESAEEAVDESLEETDADPDEPEEPVAGR